MVPRRGVTLPEPKLIASPLSRFVEENGERVEIAIYRLDDTYWTVSNLLTTDTRPSKLDFNAS